LPLGFGLMTLRFTLNVFVPQTADDYITGKDDGVLIGDAEVNKL